MGIIAAAEAASSSSKSSSSTEFLLLIVLMVVGLYFFMIRPQRRRQQKAQQQQNTINPGSEVRTTAGMYATVVEVDGDDVILEVAPGVEVRYMRRAIMEVITSGEPVDDQVDEEGDDSEYETDDATSADDDISDAHDDVIDDDLTERASANGTKAKSDSDVF
jgi:preprotein translocase subunit YajC